MMAGGWGGFRVAASVSEVGPLLASDRTQLEPRTPGPQVTEGPLPTNLSPLSWSEARAPGGQEQAKLSPLLGQGPQAGPLEGSWSLISQEGGQGGETRGRPPASLRAAREGATCPSRCGCSPYTALCPRISKQGPLTGPWDGCFPAGQGGSARPSSAADGESASRH